jgi:uncharacterized protein YqeY
MALLEQILEDIKAAMKAKESDKLATLRTLHSEIKNASIDKKKELNDETVLEVISASLKQKRDSVAQFSAGNRQDLVLAEQSKIDLLMSYLPVQLSKDEIADLVKQAISETGAASAKDMGLVMKWLTPKTKGRADGKLVSEVVRELLAN